MTGNPALDVVLHSCLGVAAMSLPNVIFFARGYQADFFPLLASDRYSGVFVTLTSAERRVAEARGATVAACFEEDFDALPVAEVADDYLITSMMADRFLGRFGTNKRREILGKEVSFWRQLLDNYQPVAVVNELVAIEIAEVLLVEARQRNIPYLACMHSVVDDQYYWLPDPISISGTKLPDAEPNDEHRAIAARYCAALEKKLHRPFYVRNLAGRHALKPVIAGAIRLVQEKIRDRSPRFRYENYEEDYSKRLAVFFRSLFISYDKISDIPTHYEVIFYPLHQEPEATLNYMSEFYSNQVSTIENIMKCLSPNQVLVVKEHPIDKGSLLQKKFNHLKKTYSGLHFLPGEVDSYAVFERSSRIVTLTSTVGWEAAAYGKKVYVLGQIFYDALPGVDRIDSFATLKRVLRAPPTGPKITIRDIESYVARIIALCYPGNPLPNNTLYSPENIARTVAGVEDIVSK